MISLSEFRLRAHNQPGGDFIYKPLDLRLSAFSFFIRLRPAGIALSVRSINDPQPVGPHASGISLFFDIQAERPDGAADLVNYS